MSFWPCYHCLPNVLPCYPPHLFFFSYTTSRSHKGMRGRKANKPVMVQRERGEERRSRTKMWRWRGNESKDVVPPNQDSPVCVCWCSWMKMCLVCWAECTYMYMYMCVCVCMAEAVFSLCVLVFACSRLSSGWLCSSSHATANCWLHSTCFVLALLCSAPIISPGACAELVGELCLTRRDSSAGFFFFFSLSFGLLRCGGHLCVRLLKAEGPSKRSGIRVQRRSLIPLISLWGWSLFTQPDDIMTIKSGSVPFHFLSGGSPVCVLGRFGMQS